MKALFVILFLGTSVASAAVDYLAIGRLITQGKADLENAKAGVACLMADYSQAPTCEKIENIDKETNSLLDSVHLKTMWIYNCGGQRQVVASGIYKFQEDYIAPAKLLAKDAAINDPVHGFIQKLADSHQAMVDETKKILAKAKLQEIYVTQCLLGQEPPSTSILEKLCK